ncbi:MAG TPA: pectate lyase [Gemmataceae bacterium]
MPFRALAVLVLTLAVLPPAPAAGPPTRAEAEAALRKAVGFFRSPEVSRHGGYVWRYNAADLTRRRGEGKATESMAWVQPPGTPTVGEAFLDAHEATGDRYYLDAARAVAHALARGQMRTGGWFYSIEFDPEKRLAFGYRDVPPRRRQQTKSTLDDDTTQSALRFLMRTDKSLGFEDEKIHDAVRYGLDNLLRVQFPNGAWYQWWDASVDRRSENDFPVKPAAYPESWPRTWDNKWTGRYFLNDNVMANVIDTLLVAYDTYGEERYLAAAKKAGDFLILAQMPGPQPAWAQQYSPEMHPVWDRKFEPPAVTGGESQGVMRTLMTLYRRTGEGKYLKPIPKALAYLKKSRLPDGRLARFYELKTNRPLYFNRDYRLTYSSADMPTHYSFIVGSNLDRIEAEYERLRQADPSELKRPQERPRPRMSRGLAEQARRVIDAMDGRGAWVEEGQIESRTFVNNVRALARFIAASEE